MNHQNLQFVEMKNAAQEKRHWVRLTRACNNHCIFCLDKETQNGSCLSEAEITINLKRGVSLGIKRVVLSGGEPSIHPDFLNIVKIAGELGYEHIQVITNGRMFAYPGFLNQAVKNGLLEITFSMHGHNNKLHDKLTKVVGSFQQSLTGLISALSIEELIVSVDVVINKVNIEYLADILKFFINLGVKEFDLLQVIPFGRAWDNRDILFYDIKKSLPFLNKAFSLSKNPNLHIWTNRFPPEYLEGFEELIQYPGKLYDEIGGRQDMFNNFLNSSKVIRCRGKRCSYCFLKSFCKDLIQLKEKGRLASYAKPFCLKKAKEAPGPEKRPKYILDKSGKDILNFLSFYIKHRYFVKGLRCQECRFNNCCAGMRCDDIRSYGFKVLQPVLDQRAKNKQVALRKNLPYSLLRLGLACNADCLFCNVPPESYLSPEMSTQQAKTEIDRLFSLDEELKLDITGGEPTLRKDLEELIQYASRKGIKIIQIQTNGILLANKEYVKKLKLAGLNQAFVALHSSYSQIHDYLVGRKNAFKGCIEGIKNLLESDLKVFLNPVVTTKNYKYLPDYIDFIKDQFPEIKSMSLSVVQPRGRAGNNKYLIPGYGIISPYIKKALILAKRQGLAVYNPYCGVPLCIGGWYNYLENCVEYCESLLKSKRGSGEDDFNTDKVKGPGCCKCDLNNFCNGVWTEYAEIHSFSDLIPVALKRMRRKDNF